MVGVGPVHLLITRRKLPVTEDGVCDGLRFPRELGVALAGVDQQRCLRLRLIFL